MVQLVDIPFVLPIAIWIWGNNDKDTEVGDDSIDGGISATICLTQISNFYMTSNCFSQLIAKGIGVCIILASCMNKTPIMKNMLTTSSSFGINRSSLFGELIMYSNGAIYSFLLGHPFTAYGENVTLLIQTIILVSMAWNYSPTPVYKEEYMKFSIGVIMYLVIVFSILYPNNLLHYLISSIWPISMYSRGMQIYETFQLKHTGSLSIATTTLNVIGNFIRILTTIKETNDYILVSSYCLGLLLNVIMFTQYWYYYQNTIQITKEIISDKKKKKE